MRIDVVFRDVDASDAVREHAEQKAEKLSHYFDRTQGATYTISKSDSHHGFRVELMIDVERSPAFVSHAEAEDLLTVIDQVTQKGVRQLTDFKEKLKQEKR